MRFIYSWSEKITSIKWCKKQLEISPETVVDLNNYIWEVYVNVLVQRPHNKIGGFNMIVEVNESMFTKRKNNGERALL